MVKIDQIEPFKTVKNAFTFDQPNQYLNDLGMNSGSTLINNSGLLISITMLIPIHIAISLLQKLQLRPTNCIKLCLTYLYTILTFTFYIRIIIEIYIFLVIGSLFEIKNYFESLTDGNNRIQSLICAIIFVVLCVTVAVISFTSWIYSGRNRIKFDKNSYMRELYSGVLKFDEIDTEEDRDVDRKVPFKVQIARFYATLFFLRRLILGFVVVFMYQDQVFEIKMYVLMGLQFLYVCYVVVVRSFQSKVDQMCEIVSEIVLLILILPLLYLTKNSKWNKVIENTYIGVILSLLIFYCVIALALFIINFVKMIRKRCKPRNKVYQRSNRNVVHTTENRTHVNIIQEDFNSHGGAQELPTLHLRDINQVQSNFQALAIRR